jgi:hypothetical protein
LPKLRSSRQDSSESSKEFLHTFRRESHGRQSLRLSSVSSGRTSYSLQKMSCPWRTGLAPMLVYLTQVVRLLSTKTRSKAASSESIGPVPPLWILHLERQKARHVIPSRPAGVRSRLLGHAKFCEFKDLLSCTILGLLDDPRYCPSSHPGCMFLCYTCS